MDDSSKNREPVEQEGKDSGMEAAVGAPHLLSCPHLSLTPALLPLPRGQQGKWNPLGRDSPISVKAKS